MNGKPSFDHQALVPLVPCVKKTSIWYEELIHMDEIPEWEQVPPRVSFDLITKFLVHVHSFITVGLEAQAIKLMVKLLSILLYYS